MIDAAKIAELRELAETLRLDVNAADRQIDPSDLDDLLDAAEREARLREALEAANKWLNYPLEHTGVREAKAAINAALQPKGPSACLPGCGYLDSPYDSRCTCGQKRKAMRAEREGMG